MTVRRAGPRLLRTLALAAVYAGIAVPALHLDAVAGFATLVWPPSGIALAALLRGGTALWPGVALGALVANLARGAPLPVALGIACGNTLAAVVGAALTRRVVRGEPQLARLRDVSALVFGAALMSTMISATVGVSCLLAGHVITTPQISGAWLAWWLGDAVGDLVVGSLLLLRARRLKAAFKGRSHWEAAALTLAVILVGWLVFGPSGVPPTHDLRQAYLLFPVLIWAGARLRDGGATLTVFVLAALAVLGTAFGFGPFVDTTLHDSLLQLQAFMLVAAGTGLLVGASKAQVEASEAQASFLARTSEILAESLDYETTVDKVARLAVPYFADWCIVDVVEEGEIRRVAVAADDPRKHAALVRVRELYPPGWDSPQPAGQALRTGAPHLIETFTARSLEETTRDPHHLELVRQLEPRSAMALPLVVQDRTVGAITFAQAESGRHYGPADLIHGEEIARRVAVAVENARLHRSSETARRLAEQHRTALAWWERVFEHAGWGVALTDAASGTLEAFNPAFARMHGYTADELEDQPLRMLFPPGQWPVLDANVRGAEETGRAIFESIHLRKDGSSFPVLIDVVGLRDGAGRMVRAANVIDISDRKRIEDERARLLESERAARAEAELASRTKDEFLAMLGHELRNPLSPIVTAIELMKLRAGHQPTREQEVIERQVRHLVRLVDDLLDVSRITRGKITLDRAPVEIAEVVAKAIETASPLLEQRRHILQVEVPSRGLSVMVDRDRLAQVVTNLLTNAAKYTPAQGRISIRAERVGTDLALSVTDNGVGIAPDVLPRVFELFVQGPRTPERPEGGLGIGLALVRSLVDLHGGSVSAKSEGHGRGSTFEMRLPLLVTRPETTPGLDTVAPFPRGREGLSILVVDDNKDAAELMADVLREAGHQVAVAFDPVEALSAVRTKAPDIAILDLGLPVMDGYELARRIRKELAGPAPRFVAVTGYGQESDRARTTAAGFHHHLVKPVNVRELVTAIETIRAP